MTAFAIAACALCYVTGAALTAYLWARWDGCNTDIAELDAAIFWFLALPLILVLRAAEAGRSARK